MELRGPQQVWIGIADFSHTGATGVDRSQQGTPLKGVVHHLSLQSHGVQSTSMRSAPTRDRPD